jgi:pimeloyl-ACP methyl ester carboxylesterase
MSATATDMPTSSVSERHREFDDFLEVGPRSAAHPEYFNRGVLGALRVGFVTLQLAPALAARAAARLFFAPRKRKTQTLGLVPVETSSFEVNGKSAPIYVFGRGKPVLVVHGWESSVARIEALIRALVIGGHQVVTFDMPAHGDSQARDTDILEVNEVIQHLSRRYGPFEAGVAHSFGGACLAYAIRQGLTVKRLVLFAVPASIAMMIDKFGAFLGLRSATQMEFRKQVAKRFAPVDIELDLDIFKNFGRAEVPGLIIHDMNDSLVPFANAVELRQAHHSMKLLATSGLTHNGVVRDAKTIGACVAFIQGR